MALRDVELVEDEPEHPAGHAEPAARSWLRRHPAVVAAVVGALLVAVGAGAALELRARQRDAARAEALRDVPGVLEPVDPAFPVRARVALVEGRLPPEHQALLSGVRAGGTTVTGLWSGSEEAVVVGVDDGSVVWRTVVAPPDGASTGGTAQVWCDAARPLDPAAGARPAPTPGTVGCVATWSLDAAPGADGVVPTLVTAVEVDPGDGRVVHRVDLPRDTSGTRVDDGWVSVGLEAGPDGPRTGDLVVRLLADDGTPRWTTRLPPPQDVSYPWSSATARGDRVLVLHPGGATLLDRRDGTVVRRHDVPDLNGGGLRPDGSLIVHAQPPASDVDAPDQRVDLFLPDGTAVDPDGDALVPVVVDDGSLGDVLLTTGAGDDARTRLRGADGRARWDVAGAVRSALAVEGSVVALRGDELVRLDGDDGRVLWRAALPAGGGDRQLLTDGAVLLVTGARRVDAWTFDGAPAWSGHVRVEDGSLAVVPGAPAPSPSGARPSGGLPEVWWSATPDGRLTVQTFAGRGSEEVLVLG